MVIRKGLPPPQISVRLVFRASCRLVVALTTALHIRQSWGLWGRSGSAMDESRALQYCTFEL